jgi:hypothetical protein
LGVLEEYLTGFAYEDAERERAVRCLGVEVEDNEILVTLQHGQRGVVADIINAAGADQYRQIATDTQLIRSGCLFRIPPTDTTGWLALHINNNNRVKGMLASGLWTRFRDHFDDHILEINPFVQQTALLEAVEQGRVSRVKLIRYERPNDRAVAATKQVGPRR